MAARSERSTAATKKKASAGSSRAPGAAHKPSATVGKTTKAAPARAAKPPAGKPAKPESRPAKPAAKAPARPAPAASPAKPAKPTKEAAKPARAAVKSAPLVVKAPAGKVAKAPAGKAPAAPIKKAGRVEEPVSSKKTEAVRKSQPPPPAKKAGGKKGVEPRSDKRVNLDRSPPPPRVAPKPRLSLRAPPPPKPPTLEERAQSVEKRLERTPEEFRKAYYERFDMSWIFHDAALEGVVYTEQELRAALDPTAPPVPPESSLKPICDEIRRHREALAYCRDQATKKRQPVTGDMIKKIYLIMHPDEGDLKSVKYRKEVPQHRLYFHEYSGPDKIATKVRQVVEWINDPETRKTRGTIRIAGRAHYDLLRAFPFPTDSGKVARMFMNLMIMRAGYPPAVIHSTDRQRYYEALKGSAILINQMVQEAIENSLASTEKLLDEYESRVRGFA